MTSSGTSAFTEAQTSGKEPQPVPGAEAQRRYPVMDPQRTQLRMGKSPKKCTKRYWIMVVYPTQCGDIPVEYLILGGTQEGLGRSKTAVFLSYSLRRHNHIKSIQTISSLSDHDRILWALNSQADLLSRHGKTSFPGQWSQDRATAPACT